MSDAQAALPIAQTFARLDFYASEYERVAQRAGLPAYDFLHAREQRDLRAHSEQKWREQQRRKAAA